MSKGVGFRRQGDARELFGFVERHQLGVDLHAGQGRAHLLGVVLEGGIAMADHLHVRRRPARAGQSKRRRGPRRGDRQGLERGTAADWLVHHGLPCYAARRKRLDRTVPRPLPHYVARRRACQPGAGRRHAPGRLLRHEPRARFWLTARSGRCGAACLRRQTIAGGNSVPTAIMPVPRCRSHRTDRRRRGRLRGS